MRLFYLSTGNRGIITKPTRRNEIHQPCGVAVDVFDNVYAVDEWPNNRLYKLSPDAQTIFWVSNGEQLKNPDIVAVNSAGSVLVRSKLKAKKFDSEGISQGETDLRIQSDMCYDSEDNLYIITNDRFINRVAPNGVCREFSVGCAACSLTVGNDKIFARAARHSLITMSFDGVTVSHCPLSDDNPRMCYGGCWLGRQYHVITSLPDGNLAVMDKTYCNILILDSGNRLVKTINFANSLTSFTSNSYGHLIVTEGLGNRLSIIDPYT